MKNKGEFKINLFIQVFLIIGLIFLFIKKLNMCLSIDFPEDKTGIIKPLTLFLSLLIIVIGFYFSNTIFHYILSLLGTFVILIDPYTSGISTSKNRFSHSNRRTNVFLSFPQEVDVNNIDKIKFDDISPKKFSITYYYDQKHNKLFFHQKDKKEITKFLDTYNLST